LGTSSPTTRLRVSGDGDNEDETRYRRIGSRNANGDKALASRAAEAGTGVGACHNADQRDADLDGGEELARVRRQIERDFRALTAIFCRDLKPRRARGDNRQFRHGKQRVEDDQTENDKGVRPRIRGHTAAA